MYACNGILFNHESPTRGETFVTRKITRGLARIKTGLQEQLYLGNLDALPRLGTRAGLCRMQWRMLQQNEPRITLSRRASSTACASLSTCPPSFLGLEIHWEGTGVEEKGIDKDGNVIVAVDPRYYRPHRGGDPAWRRRACAPRVGDGKPQSRSAT